MVKFLPQSIMRALEKVDEKRLYEIRLRADKPCRINYGGKFFYLNSGGISENVTSQTILTTPAQISEIVLRAAQFSIYAHNDRLSEGYVTVEGGARIGVAGETVYEGERVKTQKNFSSLVIRIPHEILGCGRKAHESISVAKNKNTLVISPPGCGKTTILRDLCRSVSSAGNNVLLVDERNEIAACNNSAAQLDVGLNTDIISSAGKDYAFTLGIRSLRPDYIITDELMGASDLAAVERAALSGVNVIASVHASGIGDLLSRPGFKDVINRRVFGRYIVLSGVGQYEQILDETLTAI